MPQIIFSSAEPRVLVLAVLCTAITVYLLSSRDRTPESRFLLGTFSCWTIYFLLSVCHEAMYPPIWWSPLVETGIGRLGLALFVGFAYRFRGNPFPRESRIAIAAATTAVGCASLLIVMELLMGRPLSWSVGSGTSFALFVWAEAVFVRRWLEAKNPREARALRSFALVFLLSAAAVGVSFLRDLGVFPAQSVPLVSSLLYLCTLEGFILVYVNNALRPTTFRVKIVGVSLFTMLAVLTVVSTALSPSSAETAQPVRDGLRLVPQGSGLYRVESVGINESANSSRAGESMPFDNRELHQRSIGQSGMVRFIHTPPGGAEDWGSALRVPIIDDAELLNRLAVQGSVVKSVCCILGSTLFILVFFPRFFRVSLVDPLEALLRGVDQVEQGHREVQIPVTFNDEIGRLTHNFNHMTRSLKVAEDGLKCYTESLELKVEERTSEIARKNEENERLLLNILPASIAERLKRGESIIADACAETSILFADIVGFTAMSTQISASELVQVLSALISDFDELAQKHGVEKIKTIGDAYMAVAGLPQACGDHAEKVASLAIDMLQAAERRKTSTGRSLQLRIGINSGPVIAGVIGTHKFAYDLWGDAVNTASRMESHGEPGRIQVTEATYQLLRERYEFESRGSIEVKGKGPMPAFLLMKPASSPSFA